MKTIVSFAIVILCSAILFGIASAQEDTTPPTLVDMQFVPETFDTGPGPVTVTITIHVTDDLSGFEDGCLDFILPDTTQQHGVCFGPNRRDSLIEGDYLNGTYIAKMVIPQYSGYGAWEMRYYVLVDNVGNRVDGWRPQTQSTRSTENWPSLFNEFGFLVASSDPENISELNHSLYLPMTLH